MTTGKATRHGALVLFLAAQLGLGSASLAAGGQGAGAVEEKTARSVYSAPEARDDPRLPRAGPGERTLREVGDAVFARPFHLVRLVAGIAVLPVALPVAAAFADWRDAVDICVTGPFAMVFRRPLGE